jgi:hypothetical protein
MRRTHTDDNVEIYVRILGLKVSDNGDDRVRGIRNSKYQLELWIILCEGGLQVFIDIWV